MKRHIEPSKGDGRAPSVTVAVAVLNAAEHIRECLESLLAQDFPRASYEILVIDNDSTDGTQEFVQQVCREHSNVRMFVNPVRGIGRASADCLYRLGLCGASSLVIRTG